MKRCLSYLDDLVDELVMHCLIHVEALHAAAILAAVEERAYHTPTPHQEQDTI
jgi:hypothetical protein